METIELMQVKTTKGMLDYYRDWDNYDGGIVMKNAKTINRYKELRNMDPSGKYAVFFAFSNEQFKEGYKELVDKGFIKEGEKIQYVDGLAMFGTKEGLDSYFDFHKDVDKKIVAECDPQEVYFYEFNNHECQIAWDGDKEAIEIIERLWGEDVAMKIIRIGYFN